MTGAYIQERSTSYTALNGDGKMPEDIMTSIGRLKERMIIAGYQCSTQPEEDVIVVSCTPKNPSVWQKDKISKIEFYFPEKEDLVEMNIFFSKGYAMPLSKVDKIVSDWFMGERHSFESDLVGVEWRGEGARKSASAIAMDLIFERRKPLVHIRR